MRRAIIAGQFSNYVQAEDRPRNATGRNGVSASNLTRESWTGYDWGSDFWQNKRKTL